MERRSHTHAGRARRRKSKEEEEQAQDNDEVRALRWWEECRCTAAWRRPARTRSWRVRDMARCPEGHSKYERNGKIFSLSVTFALTLPLALHLHKYISPRQSRALRLPIRNGEPFCIMPGDGLGGPDGRGELA